MRHRHTSTVRHRHTSTASSKKSLIRRCKNRTTPRGLSGARPVHASVWGRGVLSGPTHIKADTPRERFVNNNYRQPFLLPTEVVLNLKGLMHNGHTSSQNCRSGLGLRCQLAGEHSQVTSHIASLNGLARDAECVEDILICATGPDRLLQSSTGVSTGH